MKCFLTSCLITAVSFWTTGAPAGENWPQWRGPTLNGACDAKDLPETWSETENIVWKAPLPAWAGSSPVIWGDRIFLMSPSKRVSEPTDEEFGRRFPPRFRRVDDSGGRDILLICFDKRDGQRLWKKTVSGGNKLFGKHNMASPSPVTDGTHVWALTGTGRLAAYDMDGKRVWKHDLQDEYGKFGLGWGYASSPLLYRDKVIVQVVHGSTNGNPSYLAAFDKNTGRVVWKVDRLTDAVAECPDAYTTPTLLRLDDRDRLIVSGADHVTAHDPATGKEVWRVGGLNPDKRRNYRICGSPVAVDGTVYATSRQRPILAIRADGDRGRVVWTFTGKKAPDVPSAACDGKRLYLLHDQGFVTCLDAATGKPVWGPKRITGGPYSASPLLADGKLYVTNEYAVTTVLAAGPEFKQLHKNTLDGGYTLSSFAVSGHRLYLRTGRFLYCVGRKAE